MEAPLPKLAQKLGLGKDFLRTIGSVLLGLVAVNYSVFPRDPGFLKIAPNPYLLAVLIGAAQFGLAAGLWAAFLTSILVVAQGTIVRPAGAETLFPMTGLLGTIVPNFLAAVILGGLEEARRKSCRRLKEQHEELKGENLRLREQLLAVTKVKEELEQRVLGQEATVQSLYEATRSLEALEEKQVYAGILGIAERFVGANKSSLYVVDYAQDEAVLVASHGWKDRCENPARIPLLDPVIRTLVQRNEPLTVRDLVHDLDLEQAWRSLGLRSLMLVPVRERGVLLAILSVDDIPFLRLTIPTLQALCVIGELVAPAVAKAVRFAEMEAKDQIDRATELHNYRYFLEALTRELHRVARHKLQLTVLVLEIAGSEHLRRALSPKSWRIVVRAVAKMLRHDLREIDLICAGRRSGTYWVMLPLTSLEQSLKVVERLRQRVRASGKLLGLKHAKLDLWFGFATYRPYIRDAQMFIQLAEQSLELARQSETRSDPEGKPAKEAQEANVAQEDERR
jgi:diguanylate cyclase (GGDEF)-like protein